MRFKDGLLTGEHGTLTSPAAPKAWNSSKSTVSFTSHSITYFVK